MKRAIIIGLACLAAACAKEQPVVATVDPFAGTVDPSCYTVDLFTKIEFKSPGGDVPGPWRGYAGRWGGGKWAGQWCHDLYVLSVAPNGLASVVETYAPYAPWGKRAVAYRRTAQIGEDGRLRMAYGTVQIEYWLKDGAHYGQRDEGAGPIMIALARQPI